MAMNCKDYISNGCAPQIPIATAGLPIGDDNKPNGIRKLPIDGQKLPIKATKQASMMDKFIAFLAGDPHKMDESWQQTWAYFVGCKMPYILRDWHDSTFKESDIWTRDGEYYDSVRLKLASMPAFKKKSYDGDDALQALNLLVEFFADEKRKEGLAKPRRREKNHDKKKSDKEFDNLVASISEMAKSLQRLYRQSYELQRPIVEDMFANPDSVTEHELELCFDQVLNISCTNFGMELFNKLCQTFKSRYPESVADYIEIQNEMYGDDSDNDVEDTSGI